MNKEQLKQLHENTQGQPRELFIKQMQYFRKIMCSTAYDLEYKENAFKNVAQAYFRCDITEGDKDLFVALSTEFQRRSEYELFRLSEQNTKEVKE